VTLGLARCLGLGWSGWLGLGCAVLILCLAGVTGVVLLSRRLVNGPRYPAWVARLSAEIVAHPIERYAGISR
jgi:hypothetical protein